MLEEGAFNGQIIEGAAVNECLHSHRSLLVLLFPLCPLYRCCTLRSLVLPPPICIDVFGTPAGIPLWVQRGTRNTSPLLGDDPVEVYSQHDYLPNIKEK